MNNLNILNRDQRLTLEYTESGWEATIVDRETGKRYVKRFWGEGGAAAATRDVLSALEDNDPVDESEDCSDHPDNYNDSMDGDHESALASAGLGTDEDYGSFDSGEDGW